MNVTALSYSVRIRVVLKYFGELCLVLSFLTFIPFGVSLYFRETHIGWRYALVVVVLGALGAMLNRLREPKRVQANEGMVVVALIFLFAPLAMAYPFMASGLKFVDALFETISGITTTGLSTVAAIERAPSTVLYARAWMQWYGGLGIMALSLALVVEPSGIAKGLAVMESQDDDLVGGLRAHARRILVVYGTLTAGSVVLLWTLGMKPFNAVVYSLAAVSTGGFAPHSNSLAGLENGITQAAVILVCLLGAVPLVIYYALYEQKWRSNVNSLQLKAVVLSGIFISILLVLSMSVLARLPWSQSLYHGPLLAFSAQTTAGFSTMPLSDLSAGSKGIVILAMAIGGGAGSTAGGFKILRLLIFFQLLKMVVQRTCLAPHALVEPRLAGRRIDAAEHREALVLILLFFAVVTLSWLAFLFMGYDALDSLFEVVSATGTVGLSTGITSAELPALLKGILCVDMLMGRLEFIAWIVLLYPRTWLGPRLEER